MLFNRSLTPVPESLLQAVGVAQALPLTAFKFCLCALSWVFVKFCQSPRRCYRSR